VTPGTRSVAMVASLAALAVAGCQSTQDRSAEIKHEGLRKLKRQHGLVVTRQNPNVKILSTATLHDANGSAVVVQMRNLTPQALSKPQISVEIDDPAGRPVYRNDAPGLEDSLVGASLLPARGELWWVNDQVQPSGTLARVKALVGDAKPTPGPTPRIDLRGLRLYDDPVSGVAVKGQAFNRSKVEQPRLVIYAVARKGGKVVAAGRGIIERLRTGKPSRFTAFFIGDPRGAQVLLSAPPTALTAKGAS
jgi:hypothetical protein